MKRNHSSLQLLFGIGALCLGASSCSRTEPSSAAWQPPRPVRIEGGEVWSNYFASWPPWFTSSVKGSIAGLLLRDGDWVVGKETSFVYRATDGTALQVKIDHGVVRLAGKVVSISLKKEAAGREWLERASTQDLAAVRSVTFGSDATSASLPGLKRLAAANPHVDLLLESESVLRQSVQLFRPRTLMIDRLDADTSQLISGQSQLEVLFVTEKMASDFEFLRQLPRLRRLVILDDLPEKTGPLLSSSTQLRALHLPGATLRQLAELGGVPAGLEELCVALPKGPASLPGLDQLTHLKMLALVGDDDAVDLPVLKNLQQLQWVRLPKGIAQEQFAAFIAAHRNLKVLELDLCNRETDFAPLRELRGLEGLVLSGEKKGEPIAATLPKNLEVLRSLKTLKFLGLHGDLFSKSPGLVAEIQQALPDALVVPTAPFCMGSGWILALLPVALLASLVGRRSGDSDSKTSPNA